MSDKQKQMVSKLTPKWYKKMKVWQVVILVITPMAAGGEAAIYLTEANPALHGAVIVTGILLAVIRYTVKDENNDGIVD